MHSQPVQHRRRVIAPPFVTARYLLYYVEEELECGHKFTVHPTGAETFTARKRTCYECTPWLNRPDLPEEADGASKEITGAALQGEEGRMRRGTCPAKLRFLLFG
jgi:hypothetical protein